MPKAPPRPCTQPGCAAYATRDSRCDQHQRIGWQDDRRRGTRHQRGYGRAWEKLRDAVLRRDDYECQPCKSEGRVAPAKEVDHIVPKAHGGTDDPDNLQAICKACHTRKTVAERSARGGQKSGSGG